MTPEQLLKRVDVRAGIKPETLANWLRQLAAHGWLTEDEHGFSVTDAGRRRFAGLEELPLPQPRPRQVFTDEHLADEPIREPRVGAPVVGVGSPDDG